VYGASLGRAVTAGMAVTVIGLPSWRYGRIRGLTGRSSDHSR